MSKHGIGGEWSDDSGDEGLGKIETITRRDSSIFGIRKNKAFYVPAEGRVDTASEGRTQGDHVISHVLLGYIIAGLKGENIKTLPDKIYDISSSMLPDKKTEYGAKRDEIKKVLSDKRIGRKDATAAIRKSKVASKDDLSSQTKILLRDSEISEIQEKIQSALGKFIEDFNLVEWESFHKRRRADSTISTKQKAAGAAEGQAVNRLIEFNDFLLIQETQLTDDYIRGEGQSGKTRGVILANLFGVANYQDASGPRRQDLIAKLKAYKTDVAIQNSVLDKISEYLSDLIDYARTGKPDEGDIKLDDEKVLYEAIPRLVILAFSIFHNLKSLPQDKKEGIYNGLLNKILTNQGWLTKNETIAEHQVMNSNAKKVAITQDILKERISKFAKMDFETDELKILSPEERAQIPEAQAFKYCVDRPVVIAPATPASGKKGKGGVVKDSGSVEKMSKAQAADLSELDDFSKKIDLGTPESADKKGKKKEKSRLRDDADPMSLLLGSPSSAPSPVGVEAAKIKSTIFKSK